MGPDRPVQFELILDQSFRYGAGGDVDGDNKDEIALNSRLQIRLFNSPDISTTDVTNYAVESKAAPFQIGNLDRNGSVLAPTLSASLTTLLIPVQAGTVSNPYAVEIRDSTSNTPIDFYVYTLPAVPYVAWSTNSNTTPATLQITVDAVDMLPDSINGTNVMVDTNQFGVDGAPVKIGLLAKASAGIIVRPHSSVVFVQPCTPSGLAPHEVTIEVLGTVSSTFDARVEHAEQRGICRESTIPNRTGCHSQLQLAIGRALDRSRSIADQHRAGDDHVDDRSEPGDEPGAGEDRNQCNRAWRWSPGPECNRDADLHRLWSVSTSRSTVARQQGFCPVNAPWAPAPQSARPGRCAPDALRRARRSHRRCHELPSHACSSATIAVMASGPR